ncbi:MAG: hypothetical protein PF961_21925 [Planctomycetota bacterium]|jgi:hypothetical protein|nr:hypothetical protein [Planctomycetota bacterium]
MNRIGCIITVMLSLIAMTASAADPNAPSFAIPEDNGFSHGFGTAFTHSTLELHVVDGSCRVTSAEVDPISDEGWTGGPTYVLYVPSSFAGTHTGNFIGTYACDGGSGGTPPEWDGYAATEIAVIEPKTECPDPKNGKRDRTDYGVCERVTFKLSDGSAADWSDGGDQQASGTEFQWKAPREKSTVTITASNSNGEATITVNVFPPEGIVCSIDLAKTCTILGDYQVDYAGVGMNVTRTVLPLNVSFRRIFIRELGQENPEGEGYYEEPCNPPHRPTGGWAEITCANESYDDEAKAPGTQDGGIYTDICNKPLFWK